MKLRKCGIKTYSESNAFYEKFHFQLKIEKIDVGKRTLLKCCSIESVNDDFKNMYKLRTISCIRTSEELCNDDIIYNSVISRDYIQPNDILYAFYSIKKEKNVSTKEKNTSLKGNIGKVIYGEFVQNMDDFYSNSISTSENLEFVFVSLELYKVLVQSSFTEPFVKTPFTEFKTVRQEWDWANPCEFCKFVFLKSSTGAFRKKCCQGGRLVKRDLPENLMYYCRTENNDKFIKNCNIYNNMLSYGSLGLDKQYDSNFMFTGGGCVTLKGRTFLQHCRENYTKSLVYFTSGLSLDDEQQKIIDDLQRVVGPYNMNCNKTDDIAPHLRVINNLRSEQYIVNQLAIQFTTIIESMQIMKYEELKVQLTNNPVSIFDVSSYRSDERGNPGIHVTLRNCKSPSVVNAESEYYEAIGYPLLFPYGERGYCKGNDYILSDGSEINRNDYICCQMLMPEKDIYYFNEVSGMKIYCNRFNIWTQLSQHYYVEQLSRFIDTRLDHQRRLNNTHFKRAKKSSTNTNDNDNNSSDSESDSESDESDIEDGSTSKTILGECITGSPRHLRKLSLNAMHIVQTYDKPHIFLTLTSDSNWPEIHEKIHKDQTAYSRPDVTNMVYHGRLEALLHNLRKGKYFKFTIDILHAKQYSSEKNSLTDTYSGQYNDISQFHGLGILEQTIHNLKITYTGSWVNHMREGYGELSQPYNVTYKGNFKNDVPNGEGSLVVQRTKKYSNDYEVVYESSKMVLSTLTVNDKEVTVETYTGLWQDGVLYFTELDGKKRRVQYDGVIYYGSMDDANVANGEGLLLFPDGTEYTEVFSDNKVQVCNKVQYEMRVTEYQHRGLPHCHYVARLTNMPKAECMLVQWINQNISTKGFSGFDNSNKESSEYKLKEIIRQKMQHECKSMVDNPRGCKKADGKCRKFYHDTRESTTAYFDDKGFPKYKRDKNDLMIVPYNDLICLDWEGHANLEFTEMSYAIAYLYKYIFKGNTKVQTSVTEGTKDEISYFLRLRKICAMDAVNRFMGHPTYPKPLPSVTTIKIKLPSQVDLILYENNVCDLFVYFKRPESMEQLTYTEFFQSYKYEHKKNNKRKRSEEFDTIQIEQNVTNPINGLSKNIKMQVNILPRKCGSVLVRLQGLSIKSGEICYLRMLLKHHAGKSFKDYYSCNGITYTTFQESAKQHGLLKDMAFLKEEFLDIFRRETLCSKRRMTYAIWLSQDYPVNFMFNSGKYCTLWETDSNHDGYLYKEMVSDWIVKKLTENEIKNKFLSEIEKYLNDVGLNNGIFGLPKPVDITSELEYEMFKYDKYEQRSLYNQLERIEPSNEGQCDFLDAFKNNFHKVVTSENHEVVFMLLTGSGGTGKSKVVEKLAAFVRSEGYICKICAATALAASIYSDATTFHALAKIPVIEKCDRDIFHDSLSLNLTEDRLSLLLATKVIVIDEAFFSHRENFEALYYNTKLNNLRGKVIVVAGDRKQLLPIAEDGTKHDQLSVSLSSSELWKYIKNSIYTLTENMRLTCTSNMSTDERREQEQYALILEDIGNQTSKHISSFKDSNCKDDEMIYKLQCNNKYIIEEKSKTEQVLDSSLDWLFESGFFLENITSSAVIVGTNDHVDMWNKKIQLRNTNEEHVFYSNDSLADVDDDNGYIQQMLSTRLLNSKNHSSAPPHELRLKVNDVCILTRSICQEYGFVNNARVVVVKFFSRSICVRTLDAKSRELTLPRIKFRFRVAYGKSFVMIRNQFPLKLAYAFTVHKVQGQTINKLLFDVRESVFSHGALYVGLSRVRKFSNIGFVVNKESVDQSDGSLLLKNIVYTEILNNLL